MKHLLVFETLQINVISMTSINIVRFLVLLVRLHRETNFWYRCYWAHGSQCNENLIPFLRNHAQHLTCERAYSGYEVVIYLEIFCPSKISLSGNEPSRSRKFFMDNKFSENIIVKSWKFSISEFFSDRKFANFANQKICQPITFYKLFFLRKIFLSGNRPSRENFSGKIPLAARTGNKGRIWWRSSAV
jgi:hypothetical protein